MGETFHGYSKAQALRSGGKAAVREALQHARGQTLAWGDAYEQALAGAGMRIAYAAELNPPLWELGHVAWFQEYWIERNRQRAGGFKSDPGHDRGSSRLAQADAWYDSSRVEHRSRWNLPLPDGRPTRAYLADTLERTLSLLDALPEDADPDALYFFRLVALHEAMHAEAAAYMGRALGVAVSSAAGTAQPGNTGASRQLRVPAQTFCLGEPGPGFAFDNELGAHEVELDSFQIDSRPVSWARYGGFVEAGGYGERRWWSDAGWDWLQQRNGSKPVLPGASHADAPAVHLSAHEAEAWCRWAGRRLPTETEWECAALAWPASPDFGWGAVWEWTASSFQPYPGFTAHPYLDYSQPWFGTRRVLRGACHATSPWLAHPRYRNFFEPGRTDVFAGFRSCA